MSIFSKISNLFVGHHAHATQATGTPPKPANQNLENATHKLDAMLSNFFHKLKATADDVATGTKSHKA